MYRILIADDEEMIRNVIKEYAEFEGNTVMEASDGAEAVNLCKEQEFDIIIMDIMMPKLDGFQASKEIRKLNATPILMLSARGEEYDKLQGFEIGVDDYVVKPFSPLELMARIGAIIKRSQSHKEVQNKNLISYGGLSIDLLGRSVYVDGNQAELTPKEYELLIYLAENRNIALTREQLLNGIWGYDFFGDDRTVDTHIKMLRNSIGKYRSYIITLRGVGYKFEV